MVSKAELEFPLGPSANKSYEQRLEVPLLNANYQTYIRAHRAVVCDWLAGRVGIGAPTDQEERNMIKAINDIQEPNQREEAGTQTGDASSNTEDAESKTDDANPSAVDILSNTGQVGNNEDVDENMDEDVQQVYDQLLKLKVPTHLKIATSHRRWIRNTYAFCQLIGIEFSLEMKKLIHIHDMSKYRAKEALGYAVMFGEEQLNFKPLEKDEEKLEWQTTLENHYISNPHHPEYFYTKLENGQRNKSKSMQELDPLNGKTYLQESLIDMLASRGERNLKEDSEISVSKWMDIPQQYMLRYGQEDREFVLSILDNWRELALSYVKKRDVPLVGHFDKRPVVQ